MEGTLASGGATVFSTVFGSSKDTGATAISAAQMPAHTHTGPPHTHSFVAAGDDTGPGTLTQLLIDAGVQATTGTFVAAGDAVTVTTTSAGAGATGPAGSGDTHLHSLVMDLKFEDVIFATKD